MRKGRPPRDGRKDQHLDALLLQISDQPVQGQRHAIGDEIVGAGDKSNAKRGDP